jgi:hypothetical protein
MNLPKYIADTASQVVESNGGFHLQTVSGQRAGKMGLAMTNLFGRMSVEDGGHTLQGS